MIGSQAPDDRAAPTLTLIAGGIAGGALGLVVGGYLGMPYELGGSEYTPVGALFGAVLGEALLLPLGVHLANGRRGGYGRSALVSVSIAGAGLLLAVPTLGLSLLAVPPLQLSLSIASERSP